MIARLHLGDVLQGSPRDILHSKVFGVIQRLERSSCAQPRARYLDLEATALDEFGRHPPTGVFNIAEPNRAADRMAEHSRRDAANNLAVAKDWFVMIEQGFGVFHCKLDEPAGRPSLFLAEQSLASHKPSGLVHRDCETEASLERRVLVRDVVPPMTIALLDAKRVHSMIAGELETGRAPGFSDHIVDALSELTGDIKLPTQFAHV